MSFTLSYNEIYKVSEHLIERRYDDGFYEAALQPFQHQKLQGRSMRKNLKQDTGCSPLGLLEKSAVLAFYCRQRYRHNKELQKQELFTRPLYIVAAGDPELSGKNVIKSTIWWMLLLPWNILSWPLLLKDWGPVG